MISLRNIIQIFNPESESNNSNTGLKNLINDTEQNVENLLKTTAIKGTKDILSVRNLNIIKKCENNIIDYDGDDIKNNEEIFIIQPFGKQSFPDFIVLTRLQNKIIFFYLEIKSSKTNKSVWNCSLPRPKSFCIYLHRNTRTKENIFFRGDKIITEKRYNDLKKFSNNPTIKQLIEDINSEDSNWKYYQRNMYVQNFSYKNIKTHKNSILEYLDLLDIEFGINEIIFESDSDSD